MSYVDVACRVEFCCLTVLGMLQRKKNLPVCSLIRRLAPGRTRGGLVDGLRKLCRCHTGESLGAGSSEEA